MMVWEAESPKRTIEEVTAIARSFLVSNEFIYFKLKEVEFEKMSNTWNVVFDIGILGEERRTVKINDETGKVTGFK